MKFVWLCMSIFFMSSQPASSMKPPGSTLAFAAAAASGEDPTTTTAEGEGASTEQKETPALPAPEGGSDLKQVQLGEKVAFDHLGPIVLMEDGTTRYISNWDKMNERERALAWKRIGPRNEERRKKLLEQMAAREKTEEEAKNEEL